MNGSVPAGAKPAGQVVPGASTTPASPATPAGGFGTASSAQPGVAAAQPGATTVRPATLVQPAAPKLPAQPGGGMTSRLGTAQSMAPGVVQPSSVQSTAQEAASLAQPLTAQSAARSSAMQPGLQTTPQPDSQPVARPIISSTRSTARARFNSSMSSGATARPAMSIPVQQPTITLNTGRAERGGARRWIIAVVAVLVLVAIGTGVVALVTSQQGGGTVLGKFNTLAAYLESGAGYELANTEDNAEETTTAYAVEVLGLAGEAVAKYYSGLDARLKGFLTSAQGVVNAERTGAYQDNLKILQNAINYQAVGDAVISAYNAGGREGAKAYYESNIECGGSGELVAICEAEMGYYDSLAYNYMVYSEAGCYKNGMYDTDCAVNYYGAAQFLEKIGQMELPGTYLNGMIDDTARANLSEMVLTENAAMREVLGNA